MDRREILLIPREKYLISPMHYTKGFKMFKSVKENEIKVSDHNAHTDLTQPKAGFSLLSDLTTFELTRDPCGGSGGGTPGAALLAHHGLDREDVGGVGLQLGHPYPLLLRLHSSCQHLGPLITKLEYKWMLMFYKRYGSGNTKLMEEEILASI